MKQTKLRTLILAAMFAALTCVATMIIHIPSPIGGYFNLGDCMVLLSAFVLGPVWGMAAGGIGSALADLISGAMTWVPGTLVIKALMALAQPGIRRLDEPAAGGRRPCGRYGAVHAARPHASCGPYERRTRPCLRKSADRPNRPQKN